MDATAAPPPNRSVKFRYDAASGKKNQAQFRDGGDFSVKGGVLSEFIC